MTTAGSSVPRLLIADAQPLFAEALGRALALDHGVEVVPVYPDRGGAAVEAARHHRPDVVLYDFWLLGLDGAAATREMSSLVPGAKVLVTSWYHGTPHIQATLSAGASGFLPKSLRVAQVAEAVRRAAAGDDLVFAEQLAGLVDGLEARWQIAVEGGERLAGLTKREIEVLEVLGEGVTQAQAAEQLSISPGTLKNHVHHILAKTSAASHIQAVAAAREAGLLSGKPQAGEAAQQAVSTPAPTGAIPVETQGEPAAKISVLVADTQLLFADGLATALSGDPDMVVIPCLPTRAGEALEAVMHFRPDVVVYDLHLRDMEAFAAARAVSRWAPDTRVVLVSWYQGSPRVRQAMAAGPDVVLSKGESLGFVSEKVRDAGFRGPKVHADQLTRVLDLLDDRQVAADQLELLLTLTPREVQLLQLLARGRPAAELAARLCLAVGTVKNMTHAVLAKLHVHTQLEALAMAREAGYLW